MMVDLYLPNRLRRDLQMMRTLAREERLDQESFDFLVDRLLNTTEAVRRELESIEGEPEFFAVTKTGISALAAGPADTEPRHYGGLRCIDGGLT